MTSDLESFQKITSWGYSLLVWQFIKNSPPAEEKFMPINMCTEPCHEGNMAGLKGTEAGRIKSILKIFPDKIS